MLSLIISEISKKGKPYSSQCFVEARVFWEDFFSEHRNKTKDELAKLLGEKQRYFCNIFPQSDYVLAKRAMAITAIDFICNQTDGSGFYKNHTGKYYNPIEVKLAKKILKAFDSNFVSCEVKSGLDDIAKAYGLA